MQKKASDIIKPIGDDQAPVLPEGVLETWLAGDGLGPGVNHVIAMDGSLSHEGMSPQRKVTRRILLLLMMAGTC